MPDLGMTLVELLAYVGDYLSYYQDAVATEAYLDTARQRISVRRHARLVDYRMHEGSNARAWVTVCTQTDLDPIKREQSLLHHRLPGHQGRQRQSRQTGGPGTRARQRYDVFEPLLADPEAELVFRAAHCEIPFYTWGDLECCLAKGATRATLLDERARRPSLPAPRRQHKRARAGSACRRRADLRGSPRSDHRQCGRRRPGSPARGAPHHGHALRGWPAWAPGAGDRMGAGRCAAILALPVGPPACTGLRAHRRRQRRARQRGAGGPRPHGVRGHRPGAACGDASASAPATAAWSKAAPRPNASTQRWNRRRSASAKHCLPMVPRRPLSRRTRVWRCLGLGCRNTPEPMPSVRRGQRNTICWRATAMSATSSPRWTTMAAPTCALATAIWAACLRRERRSAPATASVTGRPETWAATRSPISCCAKVRSAPTASKRAIHCRPRAASRRSRRRR